MTWRSNPNAGDMPWLSGLAQRWFASNTFTGKEFPSIRALAARKRADDLTVSVAIPALNEGPTIGPICRTIVRDLVRGPRLVDELVVIDGGSDDDTVRAARAAGARVVTAGECLPEIPAVRGKGESLWRSLHVLSGDLVCWVDADIRNFEPHFVSRLVAPLITMPEISFVKAFYRRPLDRNGRIYEAEGGRVTELLARPLLNALFPELAGFLQPLSGEYAGRREALARVPFFSGYSVEVGLLVDLLEHVGLDRLAQVDLEERVHRNRPLAELAPMAYAIGRTILRRAEEWGRVKAGIDYPTNPLFVPDADEGLRAVAVHEIERPPMELTPSYLRAVRSRGAALAASLSPI